MKYKKGVWHDNVVEESRYGNYAITTLPINTFVLLETRRYPTHIYDDDHISHRGQLKTWSRAELILSPSSVLRFFIKPY